MAAMSFFDYLEEKISDILFHLFFLLLVTLLLVFFDVNGFYIFLSALIYIVLYAMNLSFSFHRTLKDYRHIASLVDSLDETYYIADILPKPKRLSDAAYYDALKKACKSMNDKISVLEEEKQAYEDYVESFAHEIKIPIGALSLSFDNNKNYALKKESDKILMLVEQMLYYARSENPEKDYFVQQLCLEDVMHRVLLKYRYTLMESGIRIDISEVNCTVYTDEKWLVFILSQIIQNALKYFDKDEKSLTIRCNENADHTCLIIEDNGCGISSSDLPRIFERGFTGSNRKKSGATGMGLYLAKKLSTKLGLEILAQSQKGVFTRFLLIFPKGNLHRFCEDD